jgi:hypothetical protein
MRPGRYDEQGHESTRSSAYSQHHGETRNFSRDTERASCPYYKLEVFHRRCGVGHTPLLEFPGLRVFQPHSGQVSQVRAQCKIWCGRFPDSAAKPPPVVALDNRLLNALSGFTHRAGMTALERCHGAAAERQRQNPGSSRRKETQIEFSVFHICVHLCPSVVKGFFALETAAVQTRIRAALRYYGQCTRPVSWPSRFAPR